MSAHGCTGAGGYAAQHEFAAWGHRRGPARFNHRGGVGVDDDRGAVYGCPRSQFGPVEEGDVMGLSLEAGLVVGQGAGFGR